MWELTAPPVDAYLRQGDLLVKVPRGKHEAGVDVDHGRLTLRASVKLGLVVGQCCTTFRGRNGVGIAPVATTGQLDIMSEYRQSLYQAEPEPDEPYHYDHFRLEPFEHLSAQGRKEWVADLSRSTPWEGSRDWLQGQRVARMTVSARRLLRIKLALHWGRLNEDDDAAELARLGLPPGLRQS